MHRRLLLGLAATIALTGACSGGSDSTPAAETTLAPAVRETAPTTEVPATAVPTTAAPTTTAPPTTTAAPTTTADLAAIASTYAETGPYPVGVATVALPGGNPVEIWYPAAKPAAGTISYDVRDYTPEAIKALLTADIPATFTIDADRDSTAADGTFPVAIYSHGFSGINVGSSFLTAHLASWGVVVAAPEHPARDLAAATGGTINQDPQVSIDDILRTIELIKFAAPTPVAGHVNTDHIVLIGHSAGGGTVLGAAAQSGDVDAYVSLASGAFGRRDDTTSTTAAPPALPSMPSLFVAGRNDAVVPWDSVTEVAYEAAPSPSRLWVIDGVGHNGFDDFCTFGDGTGIIGIAEASGLGAFLDAQPTFRTLGEDGCKPPNVPVAEAWPIVRHVVTAFVLEQSGLVEATAALDVSLADFYTPAVVAAEK